MLSSLQATGNDLPFQQYLLECKNNDNKEERETGDNGLVTSILENVEDDSEKEEEEEGRSKEKNTATIIDDFSHEVNESKVGTESDKNTPERKNTYAFEGSSSKNLNTSSQHCTDLGEGVCSLTLNAEEERDRSRSPVRVRLSDYYEVDTVGECDTMGASPKRTLSYMPGARSSPRRLDSVARLGDGGGQPVVTPSTPKYLQQGTTYDITPLMKGKFVNDGKSVPILEDHAWPSNEMLCVNESQADAIRACLTRELAIVQGPPGTGKTFISLKIAQILLLNWQVWSRASEMDRRAIRRQILVICYTNHALDQFLEGITSFEETGIVRVGSRSKTEKLDEFNLSNLKRGMRPRNIHGDIRRARRSIEDIIEYVSQKSEMMEAANKRVLSERELCEVLTRTEKEVLVNGVPSNPKMGTSFLEEWLTLEDMISRFPEESPKSLMDPQAHTEGEDIEVEDDEDVLDRLKTQQQEVGTAKRYQSDRRVMMELTKSSQMTSTERKANEQLLWDLSSSVRWKLYRRWVHVYKVMCKKRIRQKMTKYNRLVRELSELREQESLHVLDQAKVVGMTTTSAAKHQKMLCQLKPPIIIVEEAAEVLEAHIVASLTPSCQHLILIGDHQQLRPNPEVYELAKKYNLDVSLFERLIKNGVAYSKLKTQHRMRPEISKLLVPHIYSELVDHPTVFHFPTIRGISANMFFLNHEELESEVPGNSKANDYEASFLVALCRHLIKQGYKPSQITILSTYSAQQLAFKRKMAEEEFEGVYVSTVDNYQGEENDIILLSLVRSNRRGSIGFLSNSNRVCVALSRARHGLYCIGNLTQLWAKSELWRQILTYVQNAGLLVTKLNLVCQKHPNYSKEVADSNDFRTLFPEGGCTRPCKTRLDCGHACRLSCHSYDPGHKKYICLEQCVRKCPQGHPCQKRCSKPCAPCPQPLKAVLLPKCGHLQDVLCGDNLEEVQCLQKCTKTLDCGHLCSGDCHTCNGDRLHKACTSQDCSRPLVRCLIEFCLIAVHIDLRTCL